MRLLLCLACLSPPLAAIAEPLAKPPLPRELRVAAGSQEVVTAPGLQRLAIGDTSIAEVTAVGNNQVLVTGSGPGKTTLMVWQKNGRRSEILVIVPAGR